MGRGFTMLMLDLDDLKPVNDTFGHQWGDRLLKAIADTIRHTIRFTDAAARYGGDEFVVLLPETDAAGGYVVGEKLRRDIYALTLNAADRNVRSSVSIGMVAYPDDGSTIEQLVSAADVAMYEAKRRGKNRIVGYQTRTERVATAIDPDTAELVQLAPADDVRTGGDPAPWGGVSGTSSGRGYAYEAADEPQPTGQRRPDRSTIPVRPEMTEAPPWSAGSEVERRPARRPPEPPPRSPEPPEPPTDMRPAAEPPDRPWLTRTDADSPPQPPPRPRSATDFRVIDGERTRTDEISGEGGDRPWIALPIEPEEEPEEPRG
jgi:diguanylate cyclase (GGDEF)-like protein